MSATEIMEQIRKLPEAEQHALIESIKKEFAEHDVTLTDEQIAELDRRAEDALRTPGRGTPWEELRDEVLLKYKK
jgi:putative addiction module component (TIGR02574 family)